jgi:GT2 family glycosyltransferase
LVGGAIDVETLNSPDLIEVRPNPQGIRLPTSVRFLPYSIGANFAVSRLAFETLGGWDQRFAGGADDVDFCWRAQYAGFSLGFTPHAVIAYRYRSDLRALLRQHFRYGLMEPQLYRQHKDHGLQRRTWRQVAVSCRWFIRPRAPGAAGGGRTYESLWRSRSARHTWLRELAYLAGRVRGSLRYRSLFL